ncbi:MAG: methyltransferase domain-containing protein [Simkaniaceae bacterium]
MTNSVHSSLLKISTEGPFHYATIKEREEEKECPLTPNRTLRYFSRLSDSEKQRLIPDLQVTQQGKQYYLKRPHNAFQELPQTKRRKENNVHLIATQQQFRPGCWRVLPINGIPFLVTILSVAPNEKLEIKFIEPHTAPDSWKSFPISPHNLQATKISTSETLDELIVNLKRTGILSSSNVETGLRSIDRVHFCPENPYHDCAVDIGKKEYGMCISSPHMHVLGAELLTGHFETAKKCLDVGSGSGFFTAFMQHLAPQAQVWGIEYFRDLVETSTNTIQEHYPSLFQKMKILQGDGEKGLLAEAPFDIIYVGFMCKKDPETLLSQLAPGGRMLCPISLNQHSYYDPRCERGNYVCFDKELDGSIKRSELFVCSFVPSQTQGTS